MPTQSAAGSTSRKEKTDTKHDREPHDLARSDDDDRDKRTDDSMDEMFNLAHTD